MYWTVFPPLMMYMVAVLVLDTYTLSKKKILAILVAVGGLLALLSGFTLSKMQTAMGGSLVSWLFQIIEEILKILPVAFLMWRHKIAFPIDAVAYGAAMGCGFSLVENILYISFQELTLSLAVYRAIATSLMHICCTSLMGIALFHIVFRQQTRVYQRWISLILFLLPCLIHIFFNANVVAPGIAFIALIAIFAVSYLLVGSISDRQVKQWLCNDADSHIALLTALNNGTFAQTRRGQYLEQCKSTMPEETYDKMMQYVRLCLQLSVKAKGIEIAREAGLPVVVNEVDKNKIDNDYKKMRQLWRQMGTSGRSIVHPVIHLSHSDQWSLGL